MVNQALDWSLNFHGICFTAQANITSYRDCRIICYKYFSICYIDLVFTWYIEIHSVRDMRVNWKNTLLAFPITRILIILCSSYFFVCCLTIFGASYRLLIYFFATSWLCCLSVQSNCASNPRATYRTRKNVIRYFNCKKDFTYRSHIDEKKVLEGGRGREWERDIL